MAKVRALTLYVHKHPLGTFANGGWTDTHDELYVKCADGPWEVEEDDPALFVLEAGWRGSLHLCPAVEPSGAVGPMMGGCYAATSDSRFRRLCERVSGQPFYGAVAVHDRYESQAQYDALSR